MAKDITRQIANFLGLFTQDVVEGLVPEHRDDAKVPEFLHISRDYRLKEMYPRICTRQEVDEDVTVPRVVGSPTLLGCIAGYKRVLQDHAELDKQDSKNRTWLNGYYIYELDYDWRFTPSKKLVPDAPESDEKWLLNYNKDNRTFIPRKVGKVFAVENKTDFKTGESKDGQKSTITFYADIRREDGLQLSDNIRLTKGYWKIRVPYVKDLSSLSIHWEKDADVKATAIEPADYYGVKKLTAGLLGFQDIEDVAPYQF